MLTVLNVDTQNYRSIFKWLLNAVVIHITWKTEFRGHFSHNKGRDNQVATVFYANMASTSKVYTKVIMKLQGNPMSKNISQHE
jgi:hypothetical protein